MVIPSLSTLDNLKLGRGDVDLAVDLFPELRGLFNRRAGLLSGGEQQILTVARALSRMPKVLIADELSLGLAPIIVARLLEALKEAAAGGVAIILVEQHVNNALTVSDRAVVLRRGLVVLDGSSREVAGRMDEVQAAYLP
jgi:branched-chain amino acid transport system ATP-binding protein